VENTAAESDVEVHVC